MVLCAYLLNNVTKYGPVRTVTDTIVEISLGY